MLNVALLGAAHIHTPGFIKRLKEHAADVKVVGAWDHDPQRAAKAAAELGAPVVADVTALLKDRSIQAVVICSETNRHKDLVLAAARAKKHMFVEKPLGMGSKDAFAMARAIEKAGVVFQTGYFMRGSPVHQFLREQIAHGSFGKITRVRHSNCHAGSLKGWFDTDWRWMADPAIAGCGAFGDLGTHSLDILLWLMGDVERVAADINVVTGRYGDCDESGEGLLRFANGAVGSLAAGWVDVANPVTLLISGTEGHAHVDNGQFFFQSSLVPGADGKQPWAQLPPAWPHAFELFLEAIGGKANVPLVSPVEAAKRSAVMEAFYKAAATKKWVVPKN
jgi:1,5-anhydro-D-fructose reductase (1,5-anhydro-D-mannitol-forming)